MRGLGVLKIFLLAALLLSKEPARAQSNALAGRKVALISAIEVDNVAADDMPIGYSAETLRRELSIALEATGMFTVPTRDRNELEPVLQEVIRTHRGSSRMVGADFIIEPVIETLTLSERRRLAPGMRGKDLVSLEGAAALRVMVLNARTGSVQSRMAINVDYSGDSHLADPQDNDRLAYANGARGDAIHVDPRAAGFTAFSQVIAKAFAKRVLDQVNPAVVAQRSGARIYITRGGDEGYKIGEVLRVIRHGGAIRNPITGEVIGYDEQEIGRARIVETLPKMSIAELSDAAAGVQVGDVVREPVEDGED